MSKADDALENEKVVNTVLNRLVDMQVKVEKSQSGKYEVNLEWLDGFSEGTAKIRSHLSFVYRGNPDITLSTKSVRKLGLPLGIEGELCYYSISRHPFCGDDYYIKLRLISYKRDIFHQIFKDKAFYEELLANEIINEGQNNTI